MESSGTRQADLVGVIGSSGVVSFDTPTPPFLSSLKAMGFLVQRLSLLWQVLLPTKIEARSPQAFRSNDSDQLPQCPWVAFFKIFNLNKKRIPYPQSQR